MRPAAALLVLAAGVAARAGPFDAPPERYDETVNVALQQVGIRACVSGRPRALPPAAASPLAVSVSR